MKKTIIFLLTFSTLFMCFTPVFSSASVVDPEFIIESPLSESYVMSYAEDCVFSAYLGLDANNGYWQGIKIDEESLNDAGNNITYSTRMYLSNTWYRAGLRIEFHNGTPGKTIKVSFLSILLKTGVYSETIRNVTLDSNGYGIVNVTKTNASWENQLQWAFSLNGSYIESSQNLFESPYNFVRFARPAVADHTINSYIPEPKSDLSHYYLADSVYLYCFYLDAPALYYNKGSVSNGSYWNSYDFLQFIPELSKLNNTNVQVKLTNKLNDPVNVYVSKYSLISGEYVSVSTNPITQDQSIYLSFTISSDNYHSIWYDGFINLDGLDGFSRMSIRWSDTIDYHSDFIIIENTIKTISDTLIDLNNNASDISGAVDYIKTDLNSFILWFKNDFFGPDSYNSQWNNYNLRQYLNLYVDGWTKLYAFMVLDIIPTLKEIRDILKGSDEAPETESLSEVLSDYDQAEEVIVSNGQQSIDTAVSYIGSMDSYMNANRNALTAIKIMLERFSISNGINFPFILMSLTIGLVTLLIGKKLRG